MKIFGFGYKSRVGKDTAANFLVGLIRQITRNKLVIKTGFGAKLKAVCHDLYKHLGLQDADYYDTNEHVKNTKLPIINLSPVEIWIQFGTLVGREVYPFTWVEYPFQNTCDYLIIQDVRFENEANEILKRGGHIFKVVNPHVPETGSIADNQLNYYKGWSDILINDKDLKSFNNLIVEKFTPLI